MRLKHEWDWPPPRRRFYRTAERPAGPSGWNSPRAKRAVDIYWRVTITAIKMLLAVPLSMMAIGAFWLLWVIISLVV